MKKQPKNKWGVWAIAGAAAAAAGAIFYTLNKKIEQPSIFKIEDGKKTLPDWLYRDSQSVGQGNAQIEEGAGTGLFDFTPVNP